MNFEEIFQYIGEIGLYQVILYVLLGLPSYFSGYMSISMSFLGYTPEHWCYIPRLETFPYDVQKNVGIPPDEEDPTIESECMYYDLPYSNLTDEEIWNWDWSTSGYNNATLECDSWVYDKSVFISTAVTEYDLVCGEEYKISLVSTIYLFGVLIGAPVSGVLSDVFGRKIVLIVGSGGHLVVALIAAFSPNYATFATMRFFFSIFSTFAYLTAFVIVMEFIGPRYRTVAGVFYQIWFSIGFMLLPGYSYVVREFTKLQIVFAVPIAVSACYIWLVPESPRWLVSKERYEKAESILRKVAEINGREMPDKLDLSPDKDEKEVEKGTFLDLFRYPILRKEILVIYVGWLTNSLVYYGLSLNTGTLSGSIFMNSFISAFVEIPANIICIFTMLYLGRKPTLVGAFLIAGVSAFLCIPFLENEELAWLVTTFTMIGKAAITASFSVIYVYTAELFPTPIRHLAVGSSSMMARIGGLVAPFMGEPLMSIWVPMPSVIFGVFGVASGLLSLLLPETLNMKLPDTIEDAIDIGRGRGKKNDVGPIEMSVNYSNNLDEPVHGSALSPSPDTDGKGSRTSFHDD